LAPACLASQDQYEALCNFVPPLEQIDVLLAVWGGGGGRGKSKQMMLNVLIITYNRLASSNDELEPAYTSH